MIGRSIPRSATSRPSFSGRVSQPIAAASVSALTTVWEFRGE
jgi:hypothetical protein